MVGEPECMMIPCPVPESSSEKMPGVDSRETVWIGRATPVEVCNAISSVLPGAAAGHRKSTREIDTERIVASIPLILTAVPESSVGTGRIRCSRAVDQPSALKLAIAPGLHAAASERLAAFTTRVTTGVPESTSMVELAVAAAPAGPICVKTTRWVSWDATSGTHWKTPEAASKDAPAGRSETARIAAGCDERRSRSGTSTLSSDREAERMRRCAKMTHDVYRSNVQLVCLVRSRLRSLFPLCVCVRARFLPEPVVGNRRPRKSGSVFGWGWYRPGWLAMDSCICLESDLGYRGDCGPGSHGGRENSLMQFDTGLVDLHPDRLKHECNIQWGRR